MRSRTSCLYAAAILSAAIPATALAEINPDTRLVRCGEESCLEVSGYRADPASTITLNGQEVTAEGRNNWRVRLPIETVRAISRPRASTIEIALREPQSSREMSEEADLPIGLLGNISALASLEITAF